MSESIRTTSNPLSHRAIAFVWQHLWLVFSLFIMTLGVALCVRSDIGSSVISTIPFVMTLAGEESLSPALTIGEYTYVMNFILVGLQILVLRRRFEPVQLFQLLIGFLFGWLLDVNMALTSYIGIATSTLSKCLLQICGCIVLAIGISFEVRCGSVTMPGEGLPAAISKATGRPFAKMKIRVDICLVVTAVILGYIYFHTWVWNVVGPGTLIAMLLVGTLVKLIMPHIGWFDSILDYRQSPGRFLFGLARWLRRGKDSE